MDGLFLKQMSLDYCCTEEEAVDSENHFTEYTPLEGRRRFDETEEGCFLKIASVYGKLLVTGRKDIVGVLQEKFRSFSGAWFMEAGILASLNALLGQYGRQIEQVHPFYLAEQKTDVKTDGYQIVWYEREEIKQFAGDVRFTEAFAFKEAAPDVLGVAAMRDGKLLGMAGASADSPYLWQIGVNTIKGFEARGIGTMLTARLKNALLDRGVLPYYGTAVSHIASQRVAIKAGFLPLWTELLTSKKEN